MNGGLIREVVEGRDCVVPKKGHDLHDPIFLQLNLILANEAVGFYELVAELFLDGIHQRARPGLRERSFRFWRHRRFSGGGRRWWFGNSGFWFSRRVSRFFRLLVLFFVS